MGEQTGKNGEEYAKLIGRDEKEAARNIGYLIHPTISAGLSPTARVADLATGTGIFLLTLGKEYPNATLHGYDISPALWPASADVPKNMQLDTLDIKKPIPESLKDTYDLVHVRLVIAAMDPHEWPSVVSNAASLLKPGGKLQWEEADFYTANCLRDRLESTTGTAQMLLHKMMKNVERFRAGYDTLGENMEKAGLKDVINDLVSCDRLPETREASTKNGFQVCLGFHRRMSEIGAPGSFSAEQLQQLEKDLEKDLASGCYVRYDIHVVVGTRPLA